MPERAPISKLPFLGGGTLGDTLKGSALAQALDEMAERKAFLMVATPYLSFPARLLAWQSGEVRLRANQTREFLLRTLPDQGFRLRIPWGLGIAAASTRLLGVEEVEGRRVLCVQAPDRFVEDEPRRAFRVTKTGQSRAVINPGGDLLLRANLDNLSAVGACFFVTEPMPSEGLIVNRPLRLSMVLDQGPALDLEGRLVHMDGQLLGVAFEPPPSTVTAAALEAWLQPRVEEARRQWENRAALRAMAEQAARPRSQPEGALLLARDPALLTQLGDILGERLPIRACGLALAPLREALETPPQVVIVPWTGGGVQARHTLRNLAEAFPAGTPIVVLGLGGDYGGRELALELKQATFVAWPTAQGAFFARLLEGLIRRAWGA
ncbi:hypothetical protein GETHLI_31760 [Geothrix limicola]|uniref:PilZ domain-containing protein n=1 Tax=Geothrix limicola TaxID=2927978 RepID=A0ABQ5QJC1_9BACT|nr:PilZ domain-containing protein [Geothrix limicola]GLH74674.1 hypothetical protein GETHLI_31760 [Geothrix limicola]